jgi:hypothetical protein
MKKILFVMLLCFGMNTVNAQMLKFGLKAGANFSTLEGDGVDGSTYTSFHFGAVAEISLLENLSLQPELLYSSQGTKVDVAGGKPTSHLVLNSTKFTEATMPKLQSIMDKLYGKDAVVGTGTIQAPQFPAIEAQLLMPDEIKAILTA